MYKRRVEDDVQKEFVEYLQLQYPKVKFKCDYLAGKKLTKGLAKKAKSLGNTKSWPDAFIAQPNKYYAGLFIELKVEGTRLKKKDGTWASEHIANQATMLKSLSEAGYCAVFAVGFDQAKKTADQYLQSARNTRDKSICSCDGSEKPCEPCCE